MTKTANERKERAKIEAFAIDVLIAFLFAFLAHWLLTPLGESWRNRVIEGCVFAFVAIVMHKFEVLRRIKRYLDVRVTGLKGILNRGTDAESSWLPLLFRAAKPGETVDIVGRTNHKLLETSSHLLESALKRGVNIRLMLLDRGAIGPATDLRPLGIGGASALFKIHIRDAEKRLESLRDKALESFRDKDPEKHWLGSLRVYRTSVLVQNSAVILARKPKEKSKDGDGAQHGATRIIYDFSFGEEDHKKWAYYYKKKKQEGSFISQLQEFYSNMFNQYSSSFDYERSYDPVLTRASMATDRIKDLIKAHSESESVRDNALNNLMPTAVKVFEQMAQQSVPQMGPISVQVELTNRCSTSCSHCSRYKSESRSTSNISLLLPVITEPDLDVTLAESLFKDLVDLGTKTLTLSGGEPTQHPEFIRLLRAAKTTGLKVGVLSNGIGLTEEVRRALNDDTAWVRFSIDGSNEKTYAGVRTSLVGDSTAGFNEVKETLRWFDRRSVKRTKVAICYTILKHNVGDVKDMLKFIEIEFPDLLKRLTFKFAHAGNDGNPQSYLCSAADLTKLYDEVLKDPELNAKANISYLRWLVEKQFGIAELAEGKPTRSLYLNSHPQCFTPYLFSLVDSRGDVYPCCFLYEDNRSYGASALERRDPHRMGNIKDGFKEVWKGRQYQQARRELEAITPEGKYDACSRCTRHCNHNLWLTHVHQEYEQLRTLGENAGQILRDVPSEQHDVWL